MSRRVPPLLVAMLAAGVPAAAQSPAPRPAPAQPPVAAPAPAPAVQATPSAPAPQTAAPAPTPQATAPAPQATAPAAPAPGPRGREASIATLLERADYWRLQNRPAFALTMFERVLAADPRNMAGITGAAQVQAQLGNTTAARTLLEQARRVAPDDPRVGETDSIVTIATANQAQLTEARRLAQSGNAAAAVRVYREIFRNGTPPRFLAVEYYQLLAGLPEQYEEARSGLQRSAQQNPNDPTLQVAYAQLLTYREPTRAEGAAMLQRLAGNPAVSAAAVSAWRWAIIWSGATPDAAEQIDAYLARNPNDAAIRQLQTELRNSNRGGNEAYAQAFFDAGQGRLTEARTGFERALAINPNDAGSIAGLGLVRALQGDFAEGRRSLARALELAPDRRDEFEEMLSWVREIPAGGVPPARAWRGFPGGRGMARGMGGPGAFGGGYAYGAARRALEANDPDTADRLARAAAQRRGVDQTEAELVLGQVALLRNDAVTAEQRFRAALARRARLPEALGGLYEALQRQGRFAEADALRRETGFTPGPGANATRAFAIRDRAQRVDDPEEAVRILREALEVDPTNPWIKLELAQRVDRTGRDVEARRIAAEIGANTVDPQALLAAGIFASDDSRPGDALGYLERIPSNARNADMNRLIARSRMQQEVIRLEAEMRAEPSEDVRRRLLAYASRPGPSADATAEVIRAFGRLNDAAGVAAAARVAQAPGRPQDAQSRLRVAGALLESNAPNDANPVLESLRADASLTQEQRRQLDSLSTGYTIARADRLREAGQARQGYAELNPILEREPTNANANLALARLYLTEGRPRDARRIADAFLARDERNVEARTVAVDAAIQSNDLMGAERLVREGRVLLPDEPRVTVLEARVARAAGDPRRALTALELAVGQRAAQLRQQQARAGVPLGPGDPVYRVSAVVQPGGEMRDPLFAGIAQELSVTRLDAGPAVQAGVLYRYRTGTGGLSRLNEVAVPLEATFIPPNSGRLTARVEPVMLESGSLGRDLISGRSFGTNPLIPATGSFPGPRGHTAAGVSVGLTYALPNVVADLGSTPLGFQQQNVVGGLEAAVPIIGNLRLRLGAERRAVTDSVLSYSGLRDTNSDRRFGGVLRNTLRAQLEYVVGRTALYGGGSWGYLQGTNVARNYRYEVGGGLAYRLIQQQDEELTAGVDLRYTSYDRNLGAFTFGNGGYFSPQQSYVGTVQADYRRRWGDLYARIGAAVGYQYFRTSNTPVFPNDPDLQAQLVQSALVDPSVVTSIGRNSAHGPVGSVRADVEYSLTPQLRIGGLARYQRVGDFTEVSGMLFARYRFNAGPVTGAPNLPAGMAANTMIGYRPDAARP